MQFAKFLALWLWNALQLQLQLQQQQQDPFEWIQNSLWLLCTKFIDNKWIASHIILFTAFLAFCLEMDAAAATILQLQQHHHFKSI